MADDKIEKWTIELPGNAALVTDAFEVQDEAVAIALAASREALYRVTDFFRNRPSARTMQRN